MFEDQFDEYENDGKDCVVRFTKEQYNEMVTLALDCGLSVKELIFHRLFGCIDL